MSSMANVISSKVKFRSATASRKIRSARTLTLGTAHRLGDTPSNLKRLGSVQEGSEGSSPRGLFNALVADCPSERAFGREGRGKGDNGGALKRSPETEPPTSLPPARPLFVAEPPIIWYEGPQSRSHHRVRSLWLLTYSIRNPFSPRLARAGVSIATPRTRSCFRRETQRTRSITSRK